MTSAVDDRQASGLPLAETRRQGSRKSAIVLIDVINDLDFPEGDDLAEHALPMARSIAAMKRESRVRDVPVIYVNDNFGRWQSDLKSQLEYCLRMESRGREIADLLKPEDDDYFVLKPKHSGFFATTLDVLLQHLGCSSLILAGVATDICVLFTANDAYMRGYDVAVPADCVAANTREESDRALKMMQKVLKADVRLWKQLSPFETENIAAANSRRA